MASKFTISSFVAILLFCSLSSASTQQDETNREKLIANTLYTKGYTATSLMLQDIFLKYIVPLSSTHQSLTLFVPQDDAFVTLKKGQTPIDLFKYQIGIGNITRLVDDHSGLSMVYSLIPHQPLFLGVLTSDGDGFEQVNGVPIKDWNIYRDQYVTIHGVTSFLDVQPKKTTNLYQDEHATIHGVYIQNRRAAGIGILEVGGLVVFVPYPISRVV